MRAFNEEIGEDPGDVDTRARQRVADECIHLWRDGGQFVSIAAAVGRTPSGIRIGLVYTPPPLRRRGYAGALVAALSQKLLDSGRRFCFLFTDMTNPTSNKIYQQIGYQKICEQRQVLFADGRQKR
jgi:predicted GNAT family acetyltransferase